MKRCEYCGHFADVYAMDISAGGWGGYYCNAHTPKGFRVTDRIEGGASNEV